MLAAALALTSAVLVCCSLSPGCRGHLRYTCSRGAMAGAVACFRLVADYFTRAPVVLAVCFRSTVAVQTEWVDLFERHPEYEVVDVDTTEAICRALHSLCGYFLAPGTRARHELFYFTSFAGSGKSRFCGKFAQFVSLVREGDPDASTALDSIHRVVPVGSSLPSGSLSSWVKRLHVVGINFNSSRWGLGSRDRQLFKHGPFIPLYLRILFFNKGNLASSESSSVWTTMCDQCETLLKFKLINEGTLAAAVEDFLQGLAGPTEPFMPLVIIIDELQKVSDFFATSFDGLADSYRSELCRLAGVVSGHAIFSSVESRLMTRERSSSHRPVLELLCLPRVPAAVLLREALCQNAARHVYLNFNGTLASWTFTGAASVVSEALAERGVAALGRLVGDDARFATYLAMHLQDAAVGTGALWTTIESAAKRTSFTVGDLWNAPYGSVVLAHVVLDRTVAAEDSLVDGSGARLSVTWDEVRLRGHVLAVGGATFLPRLPLYALCHLVDLSRVPRRSFLYDGIRLLLSWGQNNISWCGWEAFLVAALGILSNSRVLLRSPTDEFSLTELYPSSTHTGTGAVIVECIIQAAQPRHGVNTICLSRLMRSFIDGDQVLVNKVWKLRQGAPTLDAAVLYTTVYNELAMLCVQLKFSGEDASTVLSWRESCTWVAAMEQQCKAEAGERWADVRSRVAYIIVARRRRGPEYKKDQAARPKRVMEGAIVLCWEDLESFLGSFLFGLVQHAETLFEAELE